MCVRACVRACSCSLRLMLVVKFSRLGCDSAPPRYRTQRRGCRGPAKQDTIADRELLDRPREATHIALACIFFGPAGDMAVSAQPRVSRPQPNKTALAHSRLCQRRHLAAIWPQNTPLQHEMMQVRGRFKGLRAHTHTHTHTYAFAACLAAHRTRHTRSFNSLSESPVSPIYLTESARSLQR